MAAATPTTEVNILKRLYPNGLEEALYKRCKLAMLAKKDTNFRGEGKYVVVKYNGTAGGSSDYATAVANQAASQTKRFFVTRRKEYQIFSIDGEALEAANGKEGAIIDVVKKETDGALYMWARAVARKVWGKGGGALGQLHASTTLTGTTFVFRNVHDHRHVEPGMKLQFALADGSAATADPSDVLDSGEAVTVVSVDPSTGTVTVSAALDTIASISADAYVFRQGDYARAATGLPGWNPLTAPSASESFFGVDRTTGNLQRLAGLIANVGSESTYEDVIIEAVAQGAMLGIDVKTWFTDPISFGKMAKEFGTTKEVRAENAEYKIGFKTLEIMGPDGTIKVVSDADCPVDGFWATNEDQLYIRSAGPFPKQLTNPGEKGWLQRKTGVADEVTGELGGYWNFFNDNPGNCIQGQYAI